MSFSNTLENTILDWAFTAGAATRPTAWYLALYTAAPSDSGGGTEVTGGSYARQSIGAFSVSGNVASNASQIDFPTATGSWGTVTHIGVFSAVSGGTLYAWAPLTTSKSIASGDVFRVPAGDLDITLD